MNDREVRESLQNGHMRHIHIFTSILLICACAHAAEIKTTLEVRNASGSLTGTSVSFNGQAALTGGIGNGTIRGTLALTPSSTGNFSAPFTITLTSGDTITGTLSIPASAIGGGALTGSATITGGTGTYAGATGSFPSLTGSLSMGMTLTLSFSGAGTITTGGPVTPAGPTITAVLDAASYTEDIAQGSIFVVKGSNLSASGFTQFAFPLPTASTTGNVKITFTRRGATTGTDAYLVYLYNQGGVNQLAAVLPSTLATGSYNVTVTSNGATSAPFAVDVVQRKIGLITADSTGSGLAVIQNYISPTQYDVARFTTFSSGGFTFSPAKPGQVLIAWATGMGPVTVADNNKAGAYDFISRGVNVQVIVGGKTITPLYAGRAPELAGADQINFVLPADVPTGCTVPFQVSVNGVLSNPTFIAIAPDSGADACVEPGFTRADLERFSNGATYAAGGFTLMQITMTVPMGTVKQNMAGGGFTRYSGFQLAALAKYQARTSGSGDCFVFHGIENGLDVGGGGIGLDAGAVTLTGPAGSNLSNTPFDQDASTKGYTMMLATEGIPIPGGTNGKLVPGTYTLNGAGGKDVGRFSGSVTFGAPFTITGGLPSVVNRASGLTLNWTGGNPSDVVQILGSTATSTGNDSESWSFVCTTTAGRGTFTVPSSILTQLPAASPDGGVAGTSLMVLSGPNATFKAPLTAGGEIDNASFGGFMGFGSTPTYR